MTGLASDVRVGELLTCCAELPAPPATVPLSHCYGDQPTSSFAAAIIYPGYGCAQGLHHHRRPRREPPRICRGLRTVRGWSHEQSEPILARSA
jgi:hypothetical protein